MRSGCVPRILGAGSPIIDILVEVDETFIEEKAGGGRGGSLMVSSAEFDRILSFTPAKRVKSPGGSAANTIFGLANLGIETAFLGAIGDDADGIFYRQRYEALGGAASCLREKKGYPTGRCLCLVSPDSQRTMRTDLGAATKLSFEDISADEFAPFTHLYMEGYLLFNKPLALRILDAAKSMKLVVALDLSSFEVVRSFGDIEKLLAEYVDIVFANEDEAAAFASSNDPMDALNALGRLCSVAAVKLGEKGAFIKSGDGFCSIPARRVEALDSTGAGDLWAAGFLYGMVKGKTLEEAGKIGAILGAEAVRRFGAHIPEERWLEIRPFLA